MPGYHGAVKKTSLSFPSAVAPVKFIDYCLVIVWRIPLRQRKFKRLNLSIGVGFNLLVATVTGQKIDRVRSRWCSGRRCLIRGFGTQAMCYLWICYRLCPALESRWGPGLQYWLDYRLCAAPQNGYPKYWKLANTAINFLQHPEADYYCFINSPNVSPPSLSPLYTSRMRRCCARLGVTGFVSMRCLYSGSESTGGCSVAACCQTSGLGLAKLADWREDTSLRPSCKPFYYCYISCLGISDCSLKMFIQIIWISLTWYIFFIYYIVYIVFYY